MPSSLTLPPLSRSQVRSLDSLAADSFGIPTLILMENAGRGAADWLCTQQAGGTVLVLAGAGNNGADGGVLARHLELRGFSVQVFGYFKAGSLKGDAATQWSILEKSGLKPLVKSDRKGLANAIAKADWVVDALLGTGLTRPVEGLLLEVIQTLNQAQKPVLALDIPSGIDADTGEPLGEAVRATATVTFVAPKLGFRHAEAYTGEVIVVDIGAPRALLQGFL